MANELYDLGRNSFLNGEISWGVDNIKAVLVDSALYTPNTATDQFLSIIAAGARVATSGNLVTSSADGIADATDVTYTAVPSGDPCELVIIYQDTGAAATSRLIAKIDTATNLPVTPNGGDIQIAWDNGVNKIFKL